MSRQLVPVTDTARVVVSSHGYFEVYRADDMIYTGAVGELGHGIRYIDGSDPRDWPEADTVAHFGHPDCIDHAVLAWFGRAFGGPVRVPPHAIDCEPCDCPARVTGTPMQYTRGGG